MTIINTLDSLINLYKYFSYKLEFFNFVNNDMLFIYKFIVSIINNNQNNFMIKKINNDEYNNNLNKINNIYSSYNKIWEQIKNINIDDDDSFYLLKINILKLFNSVKELSSICSATYIIEII